jgi:hypothetical protein
MVEVFMDLSGSLQKIKEMGVCSWESSESPKFVKIVRINSRPLMAFECDVAQRSLKAF